MSNERLKLTARELRDTLDRIDQVEALLAGLNDKRKTLERDTLPEMMSEAGLKAIELEDGSRVTMSTLAEGSLPKEPEKRQEALDWLVANGFENLIEVKVVGSWARGDRTAAEAEYQRLVNLGTAKVTKDEGINSKTLGARIRDRVVAGQPTPLEVLGVSVFSRARFTKKTPTIRDDNDQQ